MLGLSGQRVSHDEHHPVAIVHDYLTQRGGAERVVLSMLKAFPGAPLYVSVYEPDSTFPEFREVDVRTAGIDRVGLIRRNHRLGLPLYAPTFSRMTVPADVAICSSSGWAHGVRTTGRKIVYCHLEARWLYQTGRYLGGLRPVARAGVEVLRPYGVTEMVRTGRVEMARGGTGTPKLEIARASASEDDEGDDAASGSV